MIAPISFSNNISDNWHLVALTRNQTIKVISIAASTFLFFQYAQTGFVISLSAVVITWISEKTLRRENAQQQWFDFHSVSFFECVKTFCQKKVIDVAIIIFWVAFSSFGFCSPLTVCSPQTGLSNLKEQITAFQFIFLAVVRAPIIEEIFFRGFLQERVEDLGELFSKNIYPISETLKRKIANIVQACIFGYAHIIHGQVKRGFEWLVFLITTNTGFFLGSLKSKTDSLISSMIVHSSQNALACSVA